MYSANEIFNLAYGDSKNFMTPNVMRRGKINKNRAYELSNGRGMSNQKIYGVTIVDIDDNGNTTRRTDLSDCFQSLDSAERFIESLKE